MSPVTRELGSRGRTPKYKFGRYGPQSNEAFEAELIALTSDGEISAETKTRTRLLMPIMKAHDSRILNKEKFWSERYNTAIDRAQEYLLRSGFNRLPLWQSVSQSVTRRSDVNIEP